jgi:hypothetical protein
VPLFFFLSFLDHTSFMCLFFLFLLSSSFPYFSVNFLLLHIYYLLLLQHIK